MLVDEQDQRILEDNLLTTFRDHRPGCGVRSPGGAGDVLPIEVGDRELLDRDSGVGSQQFDDLAEHCAEFAARAAGNACFRPPRIDIGSTPTAMRPTASRTIARDRTAAVAAPSPN